jgi:penicillin-binding protein 2
VVPDSGALLGRKLGRMTLVISLLVLIVVLRLGQLQLAMGDYYLELSDGNRVRLVTVPSRRGQILDREGRTLATNRPAFSVAFVYMDPTVAAASLARLAQYLEMDIAEVQAKITAQWNRLYQPVRIRSDIPPEVHSLLEEHRAELPGVVVEPEPVRDYPYGSVGAHVLGYVHQISERQLGQPEFSGYHAGNIVGQDGIELVYQSFLAGQDGGKQVEVDARGRFRQTLGHIEAQPGQDLHLTLDIELQKVAEEALVAQLEYLRTRVENPMPQARAGAVVVLDVHTGAVLAMANYPTYDPNEFASGISQARMAELNRARAFMNRAVTGTYAPGSTFKVVTALTALEERKVTPHEVIDDDGAHWLVPSLGCRGHGPVRLEQALAVSCNVYFYEMGRRVGVDALAYYAMQLGLGVRTGIDLPGEASGLVPTTQWKQEAFKAGTAKEPEFLLAEHMMAGIGQAAHSYTPLQMAVMTAAVANGGVRYQPYLLQRVTAPDGEVVYEAEPVVAAGLTVSVDNLELVRRGMLAVTRPGGTAYTAFAGFPFPVAGKTGTAENPHGASHGWYVGYAPYTNPEIAVAVLVEQGGPGGQSAAPVARKVMDWYFSDATRRVP